MWEQVIPKGEFPELLKFRSNIDYVREVLKNTVNLTGAGEDYQPVGEVATDSKFFEYQSQVNVKDCDVASNDMSAAPFNSVGRWQPSVQPFLTRSGKEGGC